MVCEAAGGELVWPRRAIALVLYYVPGGRADGMGVAWPCRARAAEGGCLSHAARGM